MPRIEKYVPANSVSERISALTGATAERLMMPPKRSAARPWASNARSPSLAALTLMPVNRCISAMILRRWVFAFTSAADSLSTAAAIFR